MATMSIGTLSVFEPKTQQWEIFSNKVKQFILLNGIDSEDKKRAVLLTHLSDEAYLLLRNLLHPKSVESSKFDELIETLNKHLTPKRATFADLNKFYNAIQEESESVEDWAARLRGLAVHCDFESSLDKVYRDRFVLGLKPGAVRDRVCEQDASKLTFVKALEIAQQTVVAKQARATSASTRVTAAAVTKEEPLLWTRATRPGAPGKFRQEERCTVCGMKRHAAETCRYKNYRCQRCKEKGHLMKMCSSKNKTVKNINSVETALSSDQADSSICSDCKDCQLFNLRSVNYEPFLVSVVLDGHLKLTMEIDSGSGTNVISKELYKKHFSNKTIFKTNIKMCLYNGHKISPLGHFHSQVTFEGLTQNIRFFVIENGGSPLLGREFMSKFNMTITTKINKIDLFSAINSEVEELVNKYKDLFNKELGCYNRSEVNLRLKECTKPKFCKARPLPFAIKDAVEAELGRLVEVGILEPVNHSEYATPIVPVPKSNGSIRICADYSVTLNKDIYIDKYPLPRIDEVFAKLGNGQHYSKLDCSQAYNQLKLSKESQKLTTINTTKGLFMYKRLVFGLACAPAIFQRTIENLLAGIEGVTVFLDDVCVTGPTKAIHLERLEKVFQRFNDSGFRLEKSKCTFFQESVTYLGHIINKDGLHKCPKKVEAIVKVAVPSNTTELKRFLGMANYYRNFVPNASSILAPLHELLRDGTRWEWTDLQQEAFDWMKRELASDRVLAHFDPTAQLVLTVDAGPEGLGAVLAQLDAAGRERPLAFGSRSLATSERNYSQLHKEAVAIVFGVKRFHQYLYGRRDPFILKTDHKPLLAIFGQKGGMSVTTASRLVRYAIFLSAYNYKIQYTSSKENVVADFFSRAPLNHSLQSSHNDFEHSSPALNSLQLEGLPVTYKDIREATSSDSVLITVVKYVRQGWPRKIECKNILPYFLCKTDLELVDGCLLRGHRVVIPPKYRNDILKELHRSHQGIVKTKSVARARLWWPGVDGDIEQTVGACRVCAALRAAPPRAAPRPWPRPAGPWVRIHLDYMTVCQSTYLVVVDAYSKWLECIDMSGGTTTKHLLLKLNELCSRFGLPETIVSDNDVKIASQEFIECCKVNGISYLTSPIYHPCSNGQAENSVKTCKKMIKAILDTHTCKHKINEKLLEYLFEYRNTVHCSTGASPAKLMMGRDLRCRLDLIRPPHPDESSCLQDAIHTTSSCRLFNENDVVWCRSYVNRKPRWYKAKILEKIGQRMYLVKLDINDLICKRHVDQLRRYVSGSDTNVEHHLESSSPAPYTPFQLYTDETVDEWQDAMDGEARVEVEDLPQQSEERGIAPPVNASKLIPPTEVEEPSSALRMTEVGEPSLAPRPIDVEESRAASAMTDDGDPGGRVLRPRKDINYKV